MPLKAKTFVWQWISSTLAVMVAAQIVRQGIHYDHVLDLVLASLVLGLLNGFVRPVLTLLTLPLLVFTLGLFRLVINALLLFMVALLLPGFHVNSFGAALLGALIISIVTIILNALFGPRSNSNAPGRPRPRFRLRRRGPPQDAQGPVIDV
jgi:putative membrane protein